MASSPATRAKDAGNAVELSALGFNDYRPASRLGVFALAPLRSIPGVVSVYSRGCSWSAIKPLIATFARKQRQKRAAVGATRVRGQDALATAGRMPALRNSGPIDSALLRAPVTSSALREFYFGGKNRFYDQMGSRHGYPVSAFPLRAVQRGVGGLEQFLLGSTMLRKFCDAY